MGYGNLFPNGNQNLIEGIAAHGVNVTRDRNRGTLQSGISESGAKLAQLRLRIWVADLVRRRVPVIVATGVPEALAAEAATDNTQKSIGQDYFPWTRANQASVLTEGTNEQSYRPRCKNYALLLVLRKSQHEVCCRSDVVICDECVALSKDIPRADANSWRKSRGSIPTPKDIC